MKFPQKQCVTTALLMSYLAHAFVLLNTSVFRVKVDAFEFPAQSAIRRESDIWLLTFP